MTTLADALLKLAQNLKGLRYSYATADGTTSTLIDTNLQEPDGYFNQGTIFFLSGTLAGKTAIITDWDEAAHTFTFEDVGNTPPQGIRYAAFDANYQRDAMVAAINRAISELGPYPTITVDPSFVTVAGQEEYTLPSNVSNIKRVEIATNLADPYGYILNTGWFENGGILYFDMDTPATGGYQIRLFHEKPHDVVSDDDDVISDLLHPDLLAWNAAVYALITRTGLSENSEPNTKEMLSYARQQASILRFNAPKHWQKTSRVSGW